MVDISIHIRQVKPTHCHGFVLALCVMQCREQFELMLDTPRHCGHKSFLEIWSQGMLDSMKLNQRFVRRVVNSLPKHGVKAIGRKCAGLEASWITEAVTISLIGSTFHS